MVHQRKTFAAYINSTGNLLLSYGFVAKGLLNLAYSFAYNDPVARAAERRYHLI